MNNLNKRIGVSFLAALVISPFSVFGKDKNLTNIEKELVYIYELTADKKEYVPTKFENKYEEFAHKAIALDNLLMKEADMPAAVEKLIMDNLSIKTSDGNYLRNPRIMLWTTLQKSCIKFYSSKYLEFLIANKDVLEPYFLKHGITEAVRFSAPSYPGRKQVISHKSIEKFLLKMAIADSTVVHMEALERLIIGQKMKIKSLVINPISKAKGIELLKKRIDYNLLLESAESVSKFVSERSYWELLFRESTDYCDKIAYVNRITKDLAYLCKKDKGNVNNSYLLLLQNKVNSLVKIDNGFQEAKNPSSD